MLKKCSVNQRITARTTKIMNSEKRVKKEHKKKNGCWSVIKRYLENSSIHGIPFLVEGGRHWTEILFWIIACAACWYACGTTIQDTINDFLTRKTAITMDTNYLKWEIHFPALHLCFGITKQAKEYLVSIGAADPKKAGTLTRLAQWVKLGQLETLKRTITTDEFIVYRNHLTANCSELFGICKWNDKEIDCCKIFFPLHTNLGGCFSFNSLQSGRPTDPSLPKFTFNQYQRTATLTIFLNNTKFWQQSKSSLTTLITDPIEYPTALTGRESTIDLLKSRKWDVMQIPTTIDEGVFNAEMVDRHCRLSKETQGLFYIKRYNYQGCIMEAQITENYKHCNCVGHIFPLTKKYRTCNSTELKCVVDNRDTIVSAPNAKCFADCEQTQVNIYESEVDDSDRPSWCPMKLQFNMLTGPTRRYHRYTVVSLLDVVVTVGGTLGLFVGVSVLSIVEIPYWLILRRNG